MKYKSVDHLGNRFDSVRKMCKHWGVNHSVYAKRIERGASIEEALTKDKSAKDHLGNKFKSKRDMCEYWKVEPSTYYYRIKRGATVKEALTTGVNHKQIAAIIYGEDK